VVARPRRGAAALTGSSTINFDPILNRWIGVPELGSLSDEPLVTVIVPSYNQGRFIRETIESILDQTYRSLEIVVIDGASRDETLDVLKSYADEPRLRYISEPDEGVADAINKGLALARGQVCAIQSSDDRYLPDAVEHAVRALADGTTPGIVFGDIIKVDAEGRELARPVTGPYSLEAWLSKQTYIPQPAAFFRLELLPLVGGWDCAYFNADTEFWLRLIWQAPVLKIERPLALRRMHGEQRDRQREEIVESYSRMVDSSLQIRALPWWLRRAALAGKNLHRVRYNPRPTPISNRLLLWGAVLAYPALLTRLEAKHRLIPFGAEMLRWAGRSCRMLGIGKP